MASPTSWKRRLVAIEIVSLLTLIASLVIFSQGGSPAEPLPKAWLLLPALASLTMFLSFLGLMYLRWVAAAIPGERPRLQSILFAIFTATLLAIWGFAMVQTWQSLNHPQTAPITADQPQ